MARFIKLPRVALPVIYINPELVVSVQQQGAHTNRSTVHTSGTDAAATYRIDAPVEFVVAALAAAAG